LLPASLITDVTCNQNEKAVDAVAGLQLRTTCYPTHVLIIGVKVLILYVTWLKATLFAMISTLESVKYY
jgi:hypothetical protein